MSVTSLAYRSTGKSRRGFSLIELACVLAIIAIILAGVMLLFSAANERNRERDVISEMSALLSACNNLSSGAENGFAAINTQVVAQSGLLPNRWLSSDKTAIVDDYGGAVTLTPAGTALNVSLAGISPQGCVAIGTNDFGNAIINIGVNGAIWTNPGLPPPSLVSQFCQQATNTITFQFI